MESKKHKKVEKSYAEGAGLLKGAVAQSGGARGAAPAKRKKLTNRRVNVKITPDVAARLDHECGDICGPTIQAVVNRALLAYLPAVGK